MYECDYCDATFDTVSNLGGHVASVHRYGEYECETCGKTFTSLAAYRGHLGGQTSIGRDELKTELRRFTEQLGRPPTRDEMEADGTYSATAYCNEFGSWSNGIRSIGHKPAQEGRVPDEALIESIRNLANELGRVPTAPEMDEQGAYSQRTCANRFGSWANAVHEAGLEPAGKQNIPTPELLAEIDRLASELGHAPTVGEMNSEGQYHVTTYYDRFESWRQAKRHAGYGDSQDGEAAWERQKWSETRWHRQRQRVLERDDYRCQTPGCDVDQSEHHARFDGDLHIHHIKPRREFVDADGQYDAELANALDNLITLCAVHHRFWEQFAPLQPDVR
ncbi:HNH endonuclease [Haloferax alexandrinus]|uniref:HNH endonuclease n=2 Tax=Haloferax volcanii TaxID=2246 RepID=A0A847TQY6_HALVO|nr:C2H2-type zinc finger protein [Haloferax alexandrinus]NLV02937.1 HNH endonuclease [Haloferax alexandrinus]